MSIQENPIPKTIVYMQDSIGAVFLGIFAVLFWIGWMRAKTRFRGLLTEKEITHGNH